jgi:integrase
MSERPPDWDIRSADVPREVAPTGRIRFSLGTTSKRELARRREVLADLRTFQHWDIITAVRDGLISIAEVTRRIRQGGESAIPELKADVAGRVAGGSPTLREEADAYLEWYARKRAVQSTKQVTSRLKRVLEQSVEGGTVGEIRVHEVTSDILDRAIEQVSKNPSSVRALATALSGCYAWSVHREAQAAEIAGRAPRWSKNPAKGVDRPKEDGRRARPKTVSDDEVHALLAGAQLYQIAYLRAFVHVGLRLTELTHTRLHDDLDPDRWEWSIQARGPNPACGCPQCQAEGWSPKTRLGTRTFHVPEAPPELRETVEAYLEAYPCSPGEPVFRNPRTGRHWDDHALQRDFSELCEKAGVTYGRGTGVVIHALRHTCATNLVRAGVRESVIAALLGDTVQTVVTTYVHLTPDDLADAIRRAPRYA